jgi:hypothetical protein
MATESRKSDSIEWRDTPEVFEFARNVWDVAQAKELIRSKRPRTVAAMDISGVADLIGKPPVDGKVSIHLGISVNWEVAASDDVDLTVPVILVPYRDSFIPIDGWHRIAKAKILGVTELPCVVMNKAETKQIKLS